MNCAATVKVGYAVLVEYWFIEEVIPVAIGVIAA
jgi:hypothetical protein